MSKTTTIYLVRHGESHSNKNHILSGRDDDPDLTEEGKDQARKAKQELKHLHFDEVYSSDLKRAVKTAELISGAPVPEIHQLHGLRERSFGSWEGGPEHQMKAGNAKRHTMSHDEGWQFKHVHDMESDHEVSIRYVPVLEEVAKENPGKTVLVATHGGAIRITLMKLGGYSYQQIPSGSFKNAGYAELKYTPGSGFQVIQINGVKL